MRVYISADIEGVAGIAHWDEAGQGKPGYQEFRGQMTREVVAACEGARAAGATDILIKDAHGSGRNLLLDQLPAGVRIVRGWSGHPLSMVQELDRSFDAVVFIGYHSRAGSDASPLAHSFRTNIDLLRINGLDCSEFHIHAWAAAYLGVPVAFVSGDAGLCEEARTLCPQIGVCAVQQGIGASTVSLAQKDAADRIREGVQRALEAGMQNKVLPLVGPFDLAIRYADPCTAYKAAFFPGVRADGLRSVRYATEDFFEILRTLLFIA